MSARDTFKATFIDTDGSFCLPELGAIAHGATVLFGSFVIVLAFIHSVWVKNQTPDYVGFGAALASLAASTGVIVGALGKAMQWRDGKSKGDHDDNH